MLNRINIQCVVAVLLLMISQIALSASQVYQRDHEYIATEFDTKYTSRINAIDGVKQDLLEELGTYVASIMEIKEDSKGSKYANRNYVAITAGITRLEVLDENWNKIRYYVRAQMQADPDEVMRSVQALRNDYQLEDSLRASLEELEQARSKIRELTTALKKASSDEERALLNQQYVDSVRDVEVEAMYLQAMKAKVDGNFELALKKFSELADRGYAKAITRLGVLFENGMGVEMDYDRARSLYQKAIDKGHAKAYAQLGFIYERGLGVPQDYDKAAALYKKSSDMKSGLGYARLGWLYQVGKGVNKDLDRALEMYRKSADKENAQGMTLLGFLYEKSMAVDEDLDKAVELYEKSAAKGNGFGMARLGNMYLNGWGVLDKDFELALELFEQAARRGNGFGMARLGAMYEKGIEVGKDYEKALQYYRKAAEKKSIFGMFKMGMMYEKGRGLSKDIEKAKHWYRKAAELGHKKARQRLNGLKR